MSFRLIDGEYCYTEVDSNVLIKSLLHMTMTYSGYTFSTYSSYRIEQFERLMEKYGITTQEVNYFFDTNASNMIIYAVENLLFICKFVSRDTVLEIIKNLLSDKLFSSKDILISRISIDGYVNDEGIQFFIDYIRNFPDN